MKAGEKWGGLKARKPMVDVDAECLEFLSIGASWDKFHKAKSNFKLFGHLGKIGVTRWEMVERLVRMKLSVWTFERVTEVVNKLVAANVIRNLESRGGFTTQYTWDEIVQRYNIKVVKGKTPPRSEFGSTLIVKNTKSQSSYD